jgi:hypothetical protein
MFSAGCMRLRSFAAVDLAINWKGGPREMLSRASAVASSDVIKNAFGFKIGTPWNHVRIPLNYVSGVVEVRRGAC